MSRVAITAVEMVGGGVTGEGVLKGALDVLHKLSGFPNHVSILLCVYVCVCVCSPSSPLQFISHTCEPYTPGTIKQLV